MDSKNAKWRVANHHPPNIFNSEVEGSPIKNTFNLRPSEAIYGEEPVRSLGFGQWVERFDGGRESAMGLLEFCASGRARIS